MGTFIQFIAFILDFFVGFVFNSTASAFFSIICFPINAIFRTFSIAFSYNEAKRTNPNIIMYKYVLTQASVGSLSYLLGSVAGLVVYLFILLPNFTFFQNNTLGNLFSDFYTQLVALRNGTVCAGIYLIIYFVLVSLISGVYIKTQEGKIIKN